MREERGTIGTDKIGAFEEQVIAIMIDRPEIRRGCYGPQAQIYYKRGEGIQSLIIVATAAFRVLMFA